MLEWWEEFCCVPGAYVFAGYTVVSMCIVSLLVYQFVCHYFILYLDSTECLWYRLVTLVENGREITPVENIQRRYELWWKLGLFREEGGKEMEL